MNEHERTTGDQNERLDPKIHRDMAQLGWKIPQTEAEVRAAEELVAKAPDELPARLLEMPDKEPPQKRGGILERYFRDDGWHRAPDEEKAKNEGRTDRDLNRG
jgi:hypothetical protein